MIKGLPKQPYIINGDDPAIICEGETDAIALHHLFPKNKIVSLGGVQSDSCLKDINSEKIILCYDNDKAGEKGIESSLYKINTDNIQQLIFPSCYKDIEEFRRKSHSNPLDLIEYKVLKKKEKPKIYYPKTNISEIKTDITEIQKALKLIPADDRDIWINICASLKSYSDDLFDVFNSWSSKSIKYKSEEDCKVVWDSFKNNNEGITIATLFYYGKLNGYKPKYNINLDIADMSVEKQAIEILNKNPIYYDNNKKWFGFCKDKKTWISIDEVDIILYIKKSFNLYNLSDTKKRAEILNAIKDEARYRKPLELKDTQIQIGKYIFDIASDNIIESTPNYKCRFYINKDIHDVGVDEKHPFIDNLFNDWLGNDKDILYETLAFIMSPKYFIDVCFWFIGAGENGKGLFANIILNTIGVENSTAQDIELLSDPKDRFTKFFLKDKLMCSLGDGNQQAITHSKAIKMLGGCSDPIRGEMKGAGEVVFFNSAKLVGSYNTLPDTTDKTDGFYRRQYILEFKNSFSGMQNPLPNVPEREYTVLCAKSFLLLKEIYKREKKGLCKWGTVLDRRNKYERLSNPLGIFMKEKMITSYEGFFAPHTFEMLYQSWAIKNGYNQFTKRELNTRLVNLVGKKERKWAYITTDGYIYHSEAEVPKNKEFMLNEDGTKVHKQYSAYIGYKFCEDSVQIVQNVQCFSNESHIKEIKPKEPHKMHKMHKDKENYNNWLESLGEDDILMENIDNQEFLSKGIQRGDLHQYKKGIVRRC